MMAHRIVARDLHEGNKLETFEHILLDLELALVTVQDVIDRQSNGGLPEYSYVAVNLALYVRHTEATLIQFRQLMAEQSDLSTMPPTELTRM